MWTTKRCERCNGWSVDHPTQLVVYRCSTEDAARAWCAVANGRERAALLTMWRALAARRCRTSGIDWRALSQARHLNSVNALNVARQADDVPAWQRAPRLAAVLLPRGSGQEYEMSWTEG